MPHGFWDMVFLIITSEQWHFPSSIMWSWGQSMVARIPRTEPGTQMGTNHRSLLLLAFIPWVYLGVIGRNCMWLRWCFDVCKHYITITTIKLMNTSIITLDAWLLNNCCRLVRGLSTNTCLLCPLGNLSSIPRGSHGKERTGFETCPLIPHMHHGMCMPVPHTHYRAICIFLFQSHREIKVTTGVRTMILCNRAGRLCVHLSGFCYICAWPSELFITRKRKNSRRANY